MKKRILIGLLALMLLVMPVEVRASEDVQSASEYAALFETILELTNRVVAYDGFDEKVLFESAMAGMLATIDPYSELMNVSDKENFDQSIEQNYVGIGVRLLTLSGAHTIQEVFQGSPAMAAGLLVGDVIVSVDGVDVTTWTLDALVSRVLGLKDTVVTIGILRKGATLTFDLVRAPVTAPTIVMEAIEAPDTVAYIRIDSFGNSTHLDFEALMTTALEAGKTQLILDLRNNSGGYTNASIMIARLLVPEGPIVRFVNRGGIESLYTSELESPPFDNIVVLTNKHTASASEILASAIQDSGVGVVVGDTTFGKGIAQYIYTIGEDYFLKITGQTFYSRNEKPIHGVGVTPDYFETVPDYLPGDYRLYHGEDKEAVLVLKAILTYLGYPVNQMDTFYDASTHAAVKAFQKDQGLYPYGVSDYTTQKALNEALFKSTIEVDRPLIKALEVLNPA